MNNTRQYIGARYVPKFAEPIAWDKNNSYEGLTIVTYLNNSYTSKKAVPAGTEITNSEYWVVTGNYNAQVELYRQETEKVKEKVDGLDATVNRLDATVSDVVNKTNVLENNLSGLSENVNGLETDIAGNTTDITNLTNFVGNIQLVDAISTTRPTCEVNATINLGTISVPAHTKMLINAQIECFSTSANTGYIDVSIDPSESIHTSRQAHANLVASRYYGAFDTGVYVNKSRVFVNNTDKPIILNVLAKNNTNATMTFAPYVTTLSFQNGGEFVPPIPDFYRDYVSARISSLNKITGNNDSVIFVSDIHNENRNYSASIIKEILNKTSVNKVVCGGDLINEPSSKEDAVGLLKYRSNLYRRNNDTVFMEGNHDTNPYGTGRVSESELYNIFCASIPASVTNNKLYYYRDNNERKIRYIYLDTGEDGNIDSVQSNWLKTCAESVEDGWYIVLFSHMALNTSYNNRTSWTEYGVVSSVNTALANVKSKVICWIFGHVHIDLSGVVNGIRMISSTCDAHGVQATSMSSDNRDENTINEQAFDVFTFDTTNRKIHCTRFGGGQYNAISTGNYSVNDRVFTF